MMDMFGIYVVDFVRKYSSQPVIVEIMVLSKAHAIVVSAIRIGGGCVGMGISNAMNSVWLSINIVLGSRLAK